MDQSAQYQPHRDLRSVQGGHQDNAVLPAGVEPFDSGAVEEEGTFSHTFTVKGTYKYVCVYHEAMGMVGTVIVS